MSQVVIDKQSLATFISTSTLIDRIDSTILKATNLRLVFSDVFVETYLARVTYVGIRTIKELETLLGEKEMLVTAFVRSWFCGPAGRHSSLIPAGIGISFLCWSTALEEGGVEALTEFLTQHAFNSNRAPRDLAEDIKSAYEAAY